MKDLPAIAKELLELEQHCSLGRMSESELNRWRELAASLFSHDDQTYKRRSFRLPASLRGNIEIGNERYLCAIDELSYTSFTASGEALNRLKVGESISMILQPSAEAVGENLKLKCLIVRIREAGSSTSVAIEISPRNSVAKKKQFFDLIYYPSYILYLENLSLKKVP